MASNCHLMASGLHVSSYVSWLFLYHHRDVPNGSTADGVCRAYIIPALQKVDWRP